MGGMAFLTVLADQIATRQGAVFGRFAGSNSHPAFWPPCNRLACTTMEFDLPSAMLKSGMATYGN
jgi:hypothetical protein